jgi:S-formylglutathione hydrolase FrmB
MNPSFRTIEFSDPRFELEGLRWVTVKSAALQQRVDMTLFVPEQAAASRDLPLVILLHGVYGSHWVWALKGGAHRTAAKLISAGAIPPMVLAMPSDGLWGDGSGYVRHQTQDFERWIVDEVPLVTKEAVTGITSNSPTFISGLSMGGFGALRLAAKYSDRFQGAGGHSSMTLFEHHTQFVVEPLAAYACPPEDRSVFETMLRNRSSLPPIRFDCGTEDPLLPANRELHSQLERAGIAHEYAEFPGGHQWPYWETHLSAMLQFFGNLARNRSRESAAGAVLGERVA